MHRIIARPINILTIPKIEYELFKKYGEWEDASSLEMIAICVSDELTLFFGEKDHSWLKHMEIIGEDITKEDYDLVWH